MQASCVLTVPCMGSMSSHYAYPGSSKTLVDSCGAADGRDSRGDVFVASRCLCVRVGDVIQCICSCGKPAGLGPDAGDAARRVGAGASPSVVAPPSSLACKTEYLAESLDASPRAGSSCCSGALNYSPVALYADMSSTALCLPSAQRCQSLVYAPGSMGSTRAASSRPTSSRASSSRLTTPRPDNLQPLTAQQAHARTVPDPTSVAANLKTPASSSRLHSRKLSAIRKRDHLKSVAGSKPTSYLRSRNLLSSSAKSARCDVVGATIHQTATTKSESSDFLSQSLSDQNSVARVSGLSVPGESAESKTFSTSRSGLRHFKPDLSAPVSCTVEAIVSDIELDGGDDTESVQRSKRMRKKNRFHSESDTDFFGRAYVCRNITIPDPSNQKLCWTKPPLSVLIIRKHFDESVMIPFKQLVTWLAKDKNMVVFVEQSVMEDSILKDQYDFQILREKLNLFRESDDLTDKVDFIICLGGDGTLLYVSSLFQGSVPPVMAFNMGSLGFLTPFHFSEDFKGEVSRVMEGTASLLLRYRLKCVVVSHDTDHIPHVKNINKEDSWTKTHKLVLNEVVIDRGPSSYLCNLELYIEGKRVTSVQGDGLIISTPTGSTAYAVAAGASMIHPSVPCIMLTPICPHSLSFRPIVVPAGVEIKVMLSPDARGTAMVSFDGRDRREIHVGDSLRITTASYPVPSICATDQIEDWFDGLANCLNWNIRQQQRPLHSVPSATSLDSLECEPTNPLQKLANGGSSD